MISIYDCQNAIYPDGVRHKYIWCLEGHKLGSGYIRKEDVDKDKPLVCRRCQECPDLKLFDTHYERRGNDNLHGKS